MDADELLSRLADVVRTEIAPAVGDEFARTQAFIASVILEKLARQVEAADADAAAVVATATALAADLRGRLGAAAPAPVSSALDAVAEGGGQRGLGQLVSALYATRDELGEERFAALLQRVRVTLRDGLDRHLGYSK